MLQLIRKEDVINFTSFNPNELKLVKQSLSFESEGAVFSQLYQSGKWDGFIKFYDKKLNTFPLGMLDIVEAFLKKKEVKYEVINLLQPFQPTLQFNETLYKHQKDALVEFFKYRHGAIKVPTRGGKTFLASEAIRLLRNDIPGLIVLFIVDTELLFNQAIDDISSYLKIKKSKIGYIKSGVIEIQDITVATIQSIQSILNSEKHVKKRNARKKVSKSTEELKIDLKYARQNARLLKEYLQIVDFLIVDECHEYSSVERCNLIRKIKYCQFKMFMSATIFKSEDWLGNLNVRSICGMILYEIHEKDLKSKGILAQDKVMLILMNHNNNKNINVDEDSSYQTYLRETITKNMQRNSIIVNISNICRRMMLKTLVLFVFKNHGNYIQSITGDMFLTGEDKMKHRLAVKASFLKKKGGVLLASDIFKKGITLPEVQVLVNAGGGLEQSNVIQKKGRVLGVKGAKDKALIIDIIDDFKYFNSHSLNRIQVYEESVGKDNIVVFDPEDEDFYRDIQEFIKNWFEL